MLYAMEKSLWKLKLMLLTLGEHALDGDYEVAANNV